MGHGMRPDTPILEVRGLTKSYRVGAGGPFSRRARFIALRSVDVAVAPLESLGVVGESGCGKSTLARCMLRLVDYESGSVRFEGHPLERMSGHALRSLRTRMQMVFQDPYSSLNPRRTILETLKEPLIAHGERDARAIEERARAVLADVGIGADTHHRYPHQFSGGQRQRISIARALVLGPRLLVADEPVSALDVSVQAQILCLLAELRARHDLSFVFISHDLGVVRHFCDRVIVMYAGRIVESGPCRATFDEPLHPYTKLLRAACPVPDPARRALPRFPVGEIEAKDAQARGCPFRARCAHATPVCSDIDPPLRPVSESRHVACHLHTR